MVSSPKRCNKIKKNLCLLTPPKHSVHTNIPQVVKWSMKKSSWGLVKLHNTWIIHSSQTKHLSNVISIAGPSSPLGASCNIQKGITAVLQRRNYLEAYWKGEWLWFELSIHRGKNSSSPDLSPLGLFGRKWDHHVLEFLWLVSGTFLKPGFK